MKKFLLSILTIAAATITLSAAVLSPEQALSRANAANKKMKSFGAASKTVLVETRAVAQQPVYYVFATGESGYMIVSADDTTLPLLGEVEEGKFDSNTIPPAMKEWLDEYANQIAWARDNIKPDGAKYVTTAAASYTAIAPMVRTRWNQGAPYNNLCPQVGAGRCYTGCVATALAQVINYHHHPAVGTGLLSYTWNNQTLSYNLDANPFDWDNMADTYTAGGYTEAQASAVANLMYACGVGVEMGYGTNASGAPTRNCVGFLIDHMDYRKDIHMENHRYYSSAEWDALVYNQLKNFGPVQFEGFNNESGHSFVCDGYRPGGFFHINWGWGGMSDGYFVLSALNPDGQGIGGSASGYSMSQSIVANVAPYAPGQPDAYYMIRCQEGMTTTSTSANLGEGIPIPGGFYGMSNSNFTGQFGFKISGTGGYVSYVAVVNAEDLLPNWGYKSLNFTVPSSIAEGTYTITPVFKVRGSDEWQDMLIDLSKPQSITMKVEGGKAYFTSNSGAKIEVTSVEPATDFYTDTDFLINATVKNTGNLEYGTYIWGALFDMNNQQVGISGQEPIFLGAGEETAVKYCSSFSPLEGKIITAGNYKFVFANSNNQIISNPYSITIKEKPATTSISVSNLTVVGDKQKVDRNNLELTANVTCTSGYFTGNLTLYVFPYVSGQVTSVASIQTEKLFIRAGETKKVSFKKDFANGELGKTYFCQIYHNGYLGNQEVFTLDTSSAISSIAEDSAEVTAIEVFNLTGVKVADSIEGLTPGLYVIRRHHTDGSVITTREIIR